MQHMENLVTVFMGQTLLQGGTHARVYIRKHYGFPHMGMRHLAAKFVPQK